MRLRPAVARVLTVKLLMFTVVHATALFTSLRDDIVPVHRFAEGAAATSRGATSTARQSDEIIADGNRGERSTRGLKSVRGPG